MTGINHWGMAAGLLAQISLAVGGLASLHLWPRSREAMMVVPVLPGSSGTLIAITVKEGARLAGPGILPGSVVIRDGGSVSWAKILRSGGLLIAATPSDCGERNAKTG
jgi:hypothetical protein